jgi:hypothetical protein
VRTPEVGLRDSILAARPGVVKMDSNPWRQISRRMNSRLSFSRCEANLAWKRSGKGTAMTEQRKPRIYLEISGGILQQIVVDGEVEVVVVDYDNAEDADFNADSVEDMLAESCTRAQRRSTRRRSRPRGPPSKRSPARTPTTTRPDPHLQGTGIGASFPRLTMSGLMANDGEDYEITCRHASGTGFSRMVDVASCLSPPRSRI